jgi:hypothetical protein
MWLCGFYVTIGAHKFRCNRHNHIGYAGIFVCRKKAPTCPVFPDGAKQTGRIGILKQIFPRVHRYRPPGSAPCPPGAAPVRCPQQAAVSRSAGAVGTGVGRTWCPSTLPSSAHPVCQSGCGRKQPRRTVPGPSGRGRSVGGTRRRASRGQRRRGRCWGATPNALRPTEVPSLQEGALWGASSEQARGDQGVAGCSAVGGPAPNGRRCAHGRGRGPERKGPAQLAVGRSTPTRAPQMHTRQWHQRRELLQQLQG